MNAKGVIQKIRVKGRPEDLDRLRNELRQPPFNMRLSQQVGSSCLTVFLVPMISEELAQRVYDLIYGKGQFEIEPIDDPP